MHELNLKHFLFQVAIWIVVATGALSFEQPLGVPRAVTGALFLTLFLGFVTRKLFTFFDREQRLIAAGVTLSSAVVLIQRCSRSKNVKSLRAALNRRRRDSFFRRRADSFDCEILLVRLRA